MRFRRAALHVRACGAEDEVHRYLRQAEFGEVVVECGACAILHDAAQRVHLHVFAGLPEMQSRAELYDMIGLNAFEALDVSIAQSVLPKLD